jgi:hypothetical protein
MSSLDWESFRDADLSAFTATAEIWGAYISSDDLRGALIEDIEVLKDTGDAHERDDFDGEVASEVRQQAKRIVEGHEEDLNEFAARIQACCEDAEDEFKPIQDSLEELLQGANVYIFPTGGPGEERFEVSESSLYNYLSGSGTVGPMLESQADQYERDVRTDAVNRSVEFKELMDSAREVDDKYKAAFMAINDDPPPLPPFVGSADYLEKAAVYDAERASELLAGGEDGELSESELDAFNSLAGYWGDNPLFATNLMNDLGAEGLYTGLADIAAIDSPYSDAAIQSAWENLGIALATATHPGQDPHLDEAWTEAFMEQGMAVMHDPEAPQGMQDIRGYQLVAPLLSYGDYRPEFLVPVADEMLALDSRDLWYDVDDAHGLSLAGHGDNPVNYMLDAMDRNPEAALEFFTGEDRDLTVSGAEALDPFDYLMENTADQSLRSPDVSLDANMLGNALEAALTREPSGTELTESSFKPHDSSQAALAERLIEYALSHEDQFQANDGTAVIIASDGGLAPMVDNLGDITAHYMADFHQAMADPDGGADAWLAESNGIGLDLSGLDIPLTPAGEEIPGKAAAEGWFRLLGNDPEALDTAWTVSEGMMYAEVDRASTEAQWKAEVNEAVGIHADLAAALTEGALDRAGDTADAETDQINTAIDYGAKAVTFGVGAGLTYSDLSPGSGLIASTVAGEAIALVANEVKTDPAGLYPDPIANQTDAYDRIRGEHAQEATTAVIQQILAENGHTVDTEGDVQEVLDGYGVEYADGVNEYLEGQDDTMDRN